MPPVTKLNVLRPLGRYLSKPAGKHRSGRCICQDPAFVSAFRAKWIYEPETVACWCSASTRRGRATPPCTT